MCNGANLRYYKIEIGGGGCALEKKLLDSSHGEGGRVFREFVDSNL